MTIKTVIISRVCVLKRKKRHIFIKAAKVTLGIIWTLWELIRWIKSAAIPFPYSLLLEQMSFIF